MDWNIHVKDPVSHVIPQTINNSTSQATCYPAPGEQIDNISTSYSQRSHKLTVAAFILCFCRLSIWGFYSVLLSLWTLSIYWSINSWKLWHEIVAQLLSLFPKRNQKWKLCFNIQHPFSSVQLSTAIYVFRRIYIWNNWFVSFPIKALPNSVPGNKSVNSNPAILDNCFWVSCHFHESMKHLPSCLI